LFKTDLQAVPVSGFVPIHDATVDTLGKIVKKAHCKKTPKDTFQPFHLPKILPQSGPWRQSVKVIFHKNREISILTIKKKTARLTLLQEATERTS
jgi:predicted RNA-binding protein with PUA-like domain